MTVIQQMLFGNTNYEFSGIVRNSTDFQFSTTSGNTYTFLGASSTTYNIPVLNDPTGYKSIRFPVTWPATSYSFENQTQTINFTPLSTSDFNILSDIFYIFNGGRIGVGQVYGQSETNYDFYSMFFNGVQIFRVSGSYSNAYFVTSPFSPSSFFNSGQVKFTTDGSINGGNGLYSSFVGGTTYFYFSI